MHTRTPARRTPLRYLLTALSLLLASPSLAQPYEPGVTFRVYQLEGDIKAIPLLEENQTPNFDELRPSINFQDAAFPQIPAPILTRVEAFLEIPQPPPPDKRGTSGDSAWAYRFRLSSDDGSRLRINSRIIIDHDGRHGHTPRESGLVELAPGRHKLSVEHFDSGGKRSLVLEWQTPGSNKFVPIPNSSLFAESDLARVTSPGPKKIRDALATRPGDGRPLTGVHPSFDLDTFQIEGFEPRVGAMCFAGDGRLIIGTFDPLQRTGEALPDIDKKQPDKLYAISGITGDPANVKLTVAADGLYEPCGLTAVGDALYVSHRKEITKLTDTDHDGFYETHETVGSGWEGWNYHQFHFGLVHKDGKLYSTLATAMAPPKWEGMGTNAAPNGPMRGTIIETDLSSNTSYVIAGGCRTPNGIGLGPEGSLFYCDNQGTWMPANQFTEVIPGRFYGHYNNTNFVPQLAERYPQGGTASAFCDRPRTPATLLLPQNELCNSPTQPVLIEKGQYAGQMLIGELTGGGLRRAFLEKVNGQWQGAVFQFTQGLNCGINRVAWGPDGSLYVGGIGAGGNWNWHDKRFGLQRLRPNSKATFEMHSLHATNEGFIITFTKPVEAAWLASPKNYEIQQWTYAPTAEYGGPKIGEETLHVSAVRVFDDGKAVALTIPGLKAGHCVYVRTDPKSADGDQIWATEAWYTLNQIPGPLAYPTFPTLARAAIDIAPEGLGVGVLPPADSATLISRSATASFAPASENGNIPSNRSQKDLLALPEYIEMAKGQGDLTSRTSHGDCRLHVEWYCPPGGEGQMAANSGIYLQGLYEVQVLGTSAGDRKLAPDEAASIYKIKAPDTNASTGPGTWQAYDLWFRAPRFKDGKKTENARLTLYWNGELVHNDVEINGPTGSAAAKGEPGAAEGSEVQIGPLRLQEHASNAQGPVRYRNIWIAALEPLPSRPGPWQKLSLGATLDAWSIHGGNGTYRINLDEIVGRSAPNSPNTFLVTNQTYDNFELLVDVGQHVDLNSGIQFRSHVDGGLANRDGKVVGYQCELDPAERSYTGGIYDEARRGWLYPLVDAPYARSAFKSNQWNQIRILARGPLIQTWINGVPASTMFDAMDASGHIALQVHGIGPRTDPLEVRFRNIRIRELTAGQ